MGLRLVFGLEAKIFGAYERLGALYRPGDRLFLFGYSRGAYTAGALAELVSEFGLVEPSLATYRNMYWIFREFIERKTPVGLPSITMPKFEDAQRNFKPNTVKIDFLGLWDCPSSYRMELQSGLSFGGSGSYT